MRKYRLKKRPAYPSAVKQWIGIISPPALLVLLDYLSSQGIKTPSSGLLILLLLIFVSCWSGLRAGMLASALIVFYLPIAYNIPGSANYQIDDFERRLLGVVIVFPLTAFIAGLVQNKLRAAAVREFDSRAVAETEAQQRMRAENELVDSEQLRSIVVDSALDAIVAINSAGEVTLWNNSAESLFGWSRAEAIGKKLNETIIPEQYCERHENSLRECIETGKGAILGQRLELTGMHKNGQELDIELTVVRHSSPRGPVFVGFMRDISFQKRVQKEMLTAQKLESVGQLAGGIAHDFNNVLSVIVGFGELATKKLPPDHEVQQNLREILLASQRCFEINNQLLAFARKQYREPTIISVNSVIDGLRPMLQTLIKEDVELTTKLADGLVPILADSGQIEQMLTNLVINARDAMPNGGRIMIETRDLLFEPDDQVPVPDLSPGHYCTISVSDTGTGIPSENLDRIFEPFFTTKEDKGSGLGLAGAYGIVKNAGGRISVYSEVGHGTMFRIYIPAAQGKPSRTVEPSPCSAVRGTETVLVAEDNEQVRSVLEQTLTHFGYKVFSAKSGIDALAAADAYDGQIHLLITDLVMPRMGGTELAQKLAAIRPGIKVVFLSGYTEEAVTNAGVQGVVGAFLQKPVLPTDLAQMVRKVLDSAQSTTKSA